MSTQPKLNARLLQALLRVSLLTLVGGAALIVEAAPVMAQEQAPLRLALINVSGKDGRRAYEEFEEILRSSPDIQLTRGAKLEDRLEQYDLSEKILRKGDLRERHKRDFVEMMRAENLEALMIIDVYNNKRKLQVVAIGPMGEELADVQENITRGTPSRKQVVGALKEAFGKVVPAVKAFRERPVEEPVEETTEIVSGQTGKGDGAQGDTSLREEAARRVRKDNDLKVGFNASVGAFFGRRAMDLEQVNTPNGYTLQHSSPFIGIAARLDGIFTTFGEGDSAIGGNFFIAYAPFTTVFSAMSGQPPRELKSAYRRFGGEINYTKTLTSRLRLDIAGGIENNALGIDTNSYYDGSSYTSGRLGAGIVFRFGPDAYLRAHGAALPVFSSDNSDGKFFGESPFLWGLEGGALLRFTIINDVFIQLQYTYQRFSPDFPTPPTESPGIGVPTTSVDQYHTGSLQVGMSF